MCKSTVNLFLVVQRDIPLGQAGLSLTVLRTVRVNGSEYLVGFATLLYLYQYESNHGVFAIRRLRLLQ